MHALALERARLRQPRPGHARVQAALQQRRVPRDLPGGFQLAPRQAAKRIDSRRRRLRQRHLWRAPAAQQLRRCDLHRLLPHGQGPNGEQPGTVLPRLLLGCRDQPLERVRRHSAVLAHFRPHGRHVRGLVRARTTALAAALAAAALALAATALAIAAAALALAATALAIAATPKRAVRAVVVLRLHLRQRCRHHGAERPKQRHAGLEVPRQARRLGGASDRGRDALVLLGSPLRRPATGRGRATGLAPRALARRPLKRLFRAQCRSERVRVRVRRHAAAATARFARAADTAGVPKVLDPHRGAHRGAGRGIRVPVRRAQRARVRGLQDQRLVQHRLGRRGVGVRPGVRRRPRGLLHAPGRRLQRG